MNLTVTATSDNARCTTIALPRQSIETPVFMPVATLGAIRSLPLERVYAMGYSIILSNAYHLYLRPGHATIAMQGGLHHFIQWKNNILTDSGGFQVFSLNKLMKITDEGIAFRSHVDGSTHYFSAEMVMNIQMQLNSDIIMPLDHCTADNVGYYDAKIALQRTRLWLKQSIAYLNTHQTHRQQHLFGIIQGNFYPKLREQSAHSTIELDLAGYAIGGLSVGEQKNQFLDTLAHTAAFLPHTKPRYLMGVGTPEYLLYAIAEGIDMVDCVYPSRAARHGVALTKNGKMNMKNARFRMDSHPLDLDCMCNTCKQYTRSYISHLFKAKEGMAMFLLCEHNLFFMYDLCQKAQKAIKEGRYALFMNQFLSRYTEGQY